MDRLGSDLSSLASTIAGALSEFLVKPGGQSVTKSCSKNTSFLRLNHYPKCAYSQETFGLVPHTDSCFLTIVHSNNVGRIEFIKDSKWLSVKPKPNALIVNIGDLFQMEVSK
ncbi:hypothetical protein LUZ60_007010 [Juncus effusus]|nr:hypothetical protein LUZ60_007010 [Juncus effusus]